MTTLVSDSAVHTITEAERQQFDEQGFIMLPSFIKPDQIDRLKQDVDQLVSDRHNDCAQFLVDYNELGLLTSQPAMIETLKQLMGERFSMHHIHAVRQDPGCPGVNWHHDYEQFPQANRSHCMVHVFYYLNGLNGEVGDLLFIPGTHNKVMNRDALGQFGTEDLPGSVCIDDVPPGTAVIVHSALFHARRPKPGGENKSRYFIDISYCQAGIQWPAYHSYKEIFDHALHNNLGRDGRYDFLYDNNNFFPHSELEAFHAKNIGSLGQKIG